MCRHAVHLQTLGPSALHLQELMFSPSCMALITDLCFSRDTDDLLSPLSFSPPHPSLYAPSSVGSTSSSPALLGIRDPRSEYDRTQPPMQYYNSQGDTIHKGLYPGKTPVGCVILDLKKHYLTVYGSERSHVCNQLVFQSVLPCLEGCYLFHYP